MKHSPLLSFIHAYRYHDLPPAVSRQAKVCLIDLVGVAAAGFPTPLARIVRDHAAQFFAAGSGAPAARILFDGRRVSPTGAALAGGAMIESFDAHDGHAEAMGHAGVTLLPALLAYADTGLATRLEEFIAALGIGYEVALRAGIALRRLTPDAHGSGAWNGLGAAAMGARLMGLNPTAARHALGIAEYHGPRAPLTRGLDRPTMVKDGSPLGAMAGVSAAYLARAGFTGAPAGIVEDAVHQTLWDDIGRRWRILEQNYKRYPIVRCNPKSQPPSVCVSSYSG